MSTITKDKNLNPVVNRAQKRPAAFLKKMPEFTKSIILDWAMSYQGAFWKAKRSIYYWVKVKHCLKEGVIKNAILL